MTGAAGWDAVAGAWAERSGAFDRAVQGVTLELIERAGLFAGETVLELACGPGGMIPLLADVVAPGGTVLAGDSSEAMVAEAQGLVERAGVGNAAVTVMELDWLDLPSASVGALVSRFGYMFAGDPGAAFAEARRVLRPGGRLAVAAWDVPERNPYGSLPLEALAAVGLDDGPRAGDPGMFRLAPEGLLADLLLTAGFLDVEVTPVAVCFEFAGVEQLLDWVLGLSQRVVDGLSTGVDGSREEFAAELARLSAPYAVEGRGIAIPGTSLVASGRA